MWRWLRQQGIEPYFEVITPQANAIENDWLNVSGPELKTLFTELAAIDRDSFGRMWEPQPPLVGNRCMRHQVSCLLTATGEVISTWDSFAVAPEPSFGGGELYAGGTSTGNLAFLIPSSADGILRVTPGMFADDVFVATK